MKKILLGPLIALVLCATASPKSYAATQTKILKPTKVELAISDVYLNGSQTANPIIGGGGTDLNNALAEDGQFALLDPQLPGPGQDNIASLASLDYEKDVICPAANIQSVKVHVIWKASEVSTQNHAFAALIKADTSGSNPRFGVGVNADTGAVTHPSPFYGGVVTSASLSGGTFSGNVSTTLAHDSSFTQLPVNSIDINDLDSRLIVSMGDGGQGDVIQISGLLDYAYLEVTYDDSDCTPIGVTDSNIKAPKTGALLTATIILTAFSAALGSLIFGTRKTKLKHRASERE